MTRPVERVDASVRSGILWDGIPPGYGNDGSGPVPKSACLRVNSTLPVTVSVSIQMPGFERTIHVNAANSPSRFAIGANDRLLVECNGLANVAKFVADTPVFIEMFWSSIEVRSDRDSLYFYQDSPPVGVQGDTPEGAMTVTSNLDDPNWEWDNPFLLKSGLKKGIPTDVDGAKFSPAIAGQVLRWQLSPV